MTQGFLPNSLKERLYDVTGTENGEGKGFVIAFINKHGEVAVEYRFAHEYIKEHLTHKLRSIGNEFDNSDFDLD